MSVHPYVEPDFRKAAFNCPYCNAYAHFEWAPLTVERAEGAKAFTEFTGAQCNHCNQWTIWRTVVQARGDLPLRTSTLVVPQKLTSPMAHPDLPEPCRVDYEEARAVHPLSPRAAAALLRLCIQKLCKELGATGDNINADIGELVKKGLDEKLQKALDIVRVTGNNAVHPGSMSIEDNPELVGRLFRLVNIIVEEMITKPNDINEMYGALPATTLQAIENRDK